MPRNASFVSTVVVTPFMLYDPIQIMKVRYHQRPQLQGYHPIGGAGSDSEAFLGFYGGTQIAGWCVFRGKFHVEMDDLAGAL